MTSILTKLNRNEGWTVTISNTYDRNDKKLISLCYACKDSLIPNSPIYILTTQHHSRKFSFHQSCAELPGIITHPLHHHPLRVRLHSDDSFACSVCKHISTAFHYSCKDCKFLLDFPCAVHGQLSNPKTSDIFTCFHPHKLQEFHFRPSWMSLDLEEGVCRCCLKSSRDPVYVCSENDFCEFFIHQSCLNKLTKLVESVFHPEHTLFLQLQIDVNHYICEVCRGEIKALGYGCEKCEKWFHVSCATRIVRGLKVGNHEHEMCYVVLKTDRGLNICQICRGECVGAVYRCVDCNVNVHMECVPLPKFLEHVSHFHPLKLTNCIVTHRISDEYRCDICEEEGDIKEHSYYCKA